MHFSATLIAASAAVSGALAGAYYEEPVYYSSSSATYTSIKTCTDKYAAPTEAPVYEAPTTTPAYEAPTEVTYTSYEKITVTSCADYVVSCPAETYTSTAYSVSTCTGAYVPPSEYPVPSDTYYVPPANTTEYEVPSYPTEVPTEYPVPTYSSSSSEVYTHTYYTTVCPGKDYCYATTVTSTYCPGPSTSTAVVTPVPEKPTYSPVPPPVYTTATPVCPGGYDCPAPVKNETTPTYSPPPSYTGAASANVISFGVAAFAGLAAMILA